MHRMHRQCYMLIQQCLSCFWKENGTDTNDWGKMHVCVTRTLLFKQQLIIINHFQKNVKACCMPFYVLTTKCTAEGKPKRWGARNLQQLLQPQLFTDTVTLRKTTKYLKANTTEHLYNPNQQVYLTSHVENQKYFKTLRY